MTRAEIHRAAQAKRWREYTALCADLGVPREKQWQTHFATLRARPINNNEPLGVKEWKARYVAFCPKCEQDTLPLSNGRCGFCDTQLADQQEPGNDGALSAYCLHPECGKWFELKRPGSRREFCSEECRKDNWVRFTDAGRAWKEHDLRRRTERRRRQRAEWAAQGLNSRGEPKAAA